MRATRYSLLFALAAAALGSGAHELHPQSWSLLAGPGAMEHEGGLGAAYHLNARRELAGVKNLWLGSSGDGFRVPAVLVEADVFAQGGRSGARVSGCASGEGVCVRGADPRLLLGAGLAVRADLNSGDRPVVAYYIPASLMAFVRSAELHESPIGTAHGTVKRERSIAGGVGNGGGIRVRVGSLAAIVELRAILIRDVDGRTGGAVPVSLGLRW